MGYYGVYHDPRELVHFGIKRRSGRYPYGSGERPYQSERKRSYYQTMGEKVVNFSNKNLDKRIARRENSNSQFYSKKKTEKLKRRREYNKEIAQDPKALEDIGKSYLNDTVARNLALSSILSTSPLYSVVASSAALGFRISASKNTIAAKQNKMERTTQNINKLNDYEKLKSLSKAEVEDDFGSIKKLRKEIERGEYDNNWILKDNDYYTKKADKIMDKLKKDGVELQKSSTKINTFLNSDDPLTSYANSRRIWTEVPEMVDAVQWMKKKGLT